MNKIELKDAVIRSFLPKCIFKSLEGLAEFVDDSESIAECTPFVGKEWTQISRFDWKHHHYAISFFTEKARKEFLPSVIVFSLDDIDDIHLAVDGYLYHFELCKSNDDLIKLTGFNACSLLCVRDWFDVMINEFKYLSFSRIGRVMNMVDSLKNK